ncbi:MAG: cytochrome c oxidase subunit II [Bryobacteraceae bacterium]
MTVPALLLQMAVPGSHANRIADTFNPVATPAHMEKGIAILTIAICAVIFVVVGGMIVYAFVHYRAKRDEQEFEEPPQVYGSNQIELAWTVIPILIVFVLIGVSARVIRGIQAHKPAPHSNPVYATVVGHQWWWEVHYPDLGITTANEIHMPVSQKGNHATFFTLESADVDHSFWIPQLSGKTDVIPNRNNFLWMDPSKAGVYIGQCAEYCGTQHAHMGLRAIVQPVPEFKKWAAWQAKPAVEDPSVAKDKAVFDSLACINCHTVRGTIAQGKFAPDLTHLMSRQTLGAGVLSNTPQHLRDWVNDPQKYKVGCKMPDMHLDDQQLTEVVAYLETLK